LGWRGDKCWDALYASVIEDIKVALFRKDGGRTGAADSIGQDVFDITE
jgi:hypothetical protein